MNQLPCSAFVGSTSYVAYMASFLHILLVELPAFRVFVKSVHSPQTLILTKTPIHISLPVSSPNKHNTFALTKEIRTLETMFEIINCLRTLIMGTRKKKFSALGKVLLEIAVNYNCKLTKTEKK